MKGYSMHTPATDMRIRMKALPQRHRIVHLRALIARQPSRSLRRRELVALLREELATPLAFEDRTA